MSILVGIGIYYLLTSSGGRLFTKPFQFSFALCNLGATGAGVVVDIFRPQRDTVRVATFVVVARMVDNDMVAMTMV